MTYAEYKKDTYDNCMKVLEDCGDKELVLLDHLKQLLYEDDRVTGVMSGKCSSANATVLSNISEILFDEAFLKDFNAHGLNMQTVMAYGAEAIDVAARCLALSHISVRDLAAQEAQRREELTSITAKHPIRS